MNDLDRWILGMKPQIAHFTLAAAKGAIKMESRGLKHSSGKSVRKHYALLLGIKPGTKAEIVMDEIQKRLDVLTGDNV